MAGIPNPLSLRTSSPLYIYVRHVPVVVTHTMTSHWLLRSDKQQPPYLYIYSFIINNAQQDSAQWKPGAK